MELTWILIFIFAFCTMVFLALALFFPEWVGISRSEALKERKNQLEKEAQSKEDPTSPPRSKT